jgi:mannose-1-phosphate guanylyltransferase
MYDAVIMAGGSGTRLWPLSRRNRPKQSLKLVGERTMFQHAVERLSPLFAADSIFTVTKPDYVPLLASQVAGLTTDNFIVEPEGRGTAPAIGLAAIHLRRRDPDATMAVLTADHFISDTAGFRKALETAGKVAQDGRLVTLGIKPSFPSTGYGYIQQGDRMDVPGDIPVFAVKRFVEKPDQGNAERMAADGGHSWNSGMFIWRVDAILAELKRQMPAFYSQLEEVEAALGTPEYSSTLLRVWPTVSEQTIDYGIMEHARNVAVIPVEIGWTDIGSWSSLLEILPKDADGNVFRGPSISIDTRDTLVIGEKRLIATIGVRGLVIVDTEDALLVCSTEREQEVRAIVKQLKKDGRSGLV